LIFIRYRPITEFTQSEHTLWLLACDPLSVVAITSEVVAERCVDGTVVVQSAVQNVRKNTALRRNGRGVAAFVKTASEIKLNDVKNTVWSNSNKCVYVRFTNQIILLNV